MEEIQVGEFCRTKDGIIAKIEDISEVEVDEDKYYEFDNDIYEVYGEPINFLSLEKFNKYIKKHSFNPIDILKIGDFIHTDYGWGWYHHKVDENTIVIDDGDEFIDVKKDEIHRILTQEMLWNNSYEVGD